MEIPGRKVYFNMVFQFSYATPFNLKSFYNPPIFSNGGRNIQGVANFTDNNLNTTLDTMENKNISPINEKRNHEDDVKKKKRDISAGEFYKSLESTVFQYV